MPIGPRRTGTPEVAPAPSRTTTGPATPQAPAAPTTPAAWGTTPGVQPTTTPGLDPATAAAEARRAAALAGTTTPPPAVRASVAVAFDAIKAPGGPAKARILDDGLDAWNARLDLIETAKTSIDASYFIVEKDPYGFAFLGGLLKKQLEGVDVRLSIDAMADTFGKHGFKRAGHGKDYLQELVNHGGQAYVYHPVIERPFDALKGDYSVLASNHDKILVADGRAGITGGRNVARDYFADPKDLKGAWRDMDVLVEGPGAAKGLQEAFEAELANGGASKAVGGDRLGNWDKKDLQLLGAYEVMQAWTRAPALSEDQKTALRGDKAAQEKLAGELVQQALAKVATYLPEKLKREPSDEDKAFLQEQALELVSHVETRGSRAKFEVAGATTRQTEVKIIDQTSAAAGQRVNNMAPALTALVEGASKRIVVQNPYVVLTTDMMNALERASARGVKIDIITNSPLSTDSDVTQAFFLDDWKMILARCPTANIYVATGDRKFHTKSAVIDDDQSIVSTYNLDLLSGFVNGEVGAVVKSKELATDLLGAFESDKADKANGFIEYKIKRSADGKPVIENGEPVREFGPEDHLSAELLETYRKKSNLWGNFVRNNVPHFKPLRHEEPK